MIAWWLVYAADFDDAGNSRLSGGAGGFDCGF